MKRKRRLKSKERPVSHVNAFKIIIVSVLLVLFISSIYISYRYGERKILNVFIAEGSCKALIVDQLGADFPNPELIGNITSQLESAGCTVTLIPSNSFKLYSIRLFKYYDIIIFRGHTGWANVLNPETGQIKVYVALFTGERYSPNLYTKLQAKGYVAEGIPLARPRPGYNKTYIAVTQYYLRKYMQVKRGSIIILSTCFAGSQILADIFMEKGASIVIGWKGNVTVYHADEALWKLVSYYSKYKSWIKAYEMLPKDYKVDLVTHARMVIYYGRNIR
jgi:hypothetical protein